MNAVSAPVLNGARLVSHLTFVCARVAELADAGGLNLPVREVRAGSNPTPGTKRELVVCGLGRLVNGSDRRPMCTKCARNVH